MERALYIIGALIGLYLLLLMGRTNHKGLEALKGWNYAHRGLHGNGRPENSMAAFRAALEHGYGIELDVHLLKDGTLAVIHDSALIRTTGAEGRVEDLTEADLANYHLEGTEETIPTLNQVLELFQGKAPLIIELKPVDGNHVALTDAACALLENYEGVYCMESFDPRCVSHLKGRHPKVIRGQLAENFFAANSKMNPVIKFMLTHSLCNTATTPDFLAYKFADRKYSLSTFLCLKFWGIQGVSWTLKTPEEHAIAVKEGWIPIFEDYLP